MSIKTYTVNEELDKLSQEELLQFSVMTDDDITIFDCPKCSTGKLVKLTNSRTGDKFLGCTNFPDCKHTQRPEPEEEDKFSSDIPDLVSVWKYAQRSECEEEDKFSGGIPYSVWK